jgi:hypothetical protein
MSERPRNPLATTVAARQQRRLRRTGLASALTLGILAGVANAATYSASSEADLIQAINSANASAGADTIKITADIMLSAALPAVTEALTLQGIGGQRAIARDDTGSNACAPTATNAFRLIDASADLTLSNLKLSGGCNLVDQGGAVRVQHAALRLEKSTVTGNRTFVDNPDYHYGAGVGGGVAALYGSLALVDSVVSGNGTRGNLACGGGAAAFLSDLRVVRSTISGNHTSGPGSYGGGIYVLGNYPVLTTVSVSDSAFTNNSTSGAYANGGGLSAYGVGTTTIVASQFTGNSVSGYINDRGGGINISNPPFLDGATTTIDRCTISNNSIASDSGWGAGLRLVGGLVSISSSSVINNRIDASDRARGGGIWIEDANATLTNTTVSGNEASGSDVGSGGVSILSEAPNTMSLSVYNSTITGNRGLGGTGGIWLQRENDASVPPRLTLESTIVAGNTGQDGFDEIGFGFTHDPVPAPASPVVVANHSLIQGKVDVGATGTYTPDATTVALAGLDPLLLPLADNGGPNPTHALGCGSPAVNAGSNVIPLKWDQRGNGFPRKTGQNVDIGAVETRCQ